MERHAAQCPGCKKELDDEPAFQHIGVTARDLEDRVNLWPGVEQRLVDRDTLNQPEPVRRPLYKRWAAVFMPKPRLWATGALAAAVLLVLALLIPIFQHQDHGPGNNSAQRGENKEIVINFVSVGKRPAKTIYFQPGDKDKLIVWVKKT